MTMLLIFAIKIHSLIFGLKSDQNKFDKRKLKHICSSFNLGLTSVVATNRLHFFCLKKKPHELSQASSEIDLHSFIIF